MIVLIVPDELEDVVRNFVRLLKKVDSEEMKGASVIILEEKE